MDEADLSSIRLSARRALAFAKGKNKDTAIEIESSPSPPRPISVKSGSEDEDDEFEEVAIPGGAGSSSSPAVHGQPFGNGESLETVEDDIDYFEEEDEASQVIRLEIGGETTEEKAKRLALAMRKKPMTSKDRAIRLEVHKMHVVCLLASARIRNRWASNALLQARLLSLLPHQLQAAFVIPPKRFPDRAQRSRLFLDALQNLVTWWSQSFFDISDDTLGMRTRTWDDVQEVIDQLPRLDKSDFIGGIFARKPAQDKKGKGKAKDDMDPLLATLAEELGGERLRSVNSVMKKALQQEGSRDMSALLFVALCRACGIGTRLVMSVQAVPWRAEKVAPKKKSKVGAGNGGRSNASRQGLGPDGASEEDEMEEVPIPGIDDSRKTRKNNTRGGHTPKMKDPADLYRLRKQRPTPQTVGGSKLKRKKEDMSTQPPVFWAEVFSRSDQRWIPVDPLSGVIRKKGFYEPMGDSGPVRMVYVVGFEEDGYARDVTRRYAKNFGAKTSKLRPPVAKAGDETDWWTETTRFLQRPLHLNRDDLEDAELEYDQASEGMPKHMTGFKDHPIYVLERHLKRDEVLLPKREIGKFKGESVYRRNNVLQCKTAENWMRSGRQIKSRQEPLKWVKQRAVTIEKRRAQELALQEGQEPILQGLYAQYQTELYKPPPIKDGVIPQNAFGNIDLYVPTMLPEGAVHLAYKGIAKVAKQLGVSYSEAVTSFEFKKQRAVPVITGIVVAVENRETVLEAYWESAAAAEEREKAKREDRALKRWVQLINGLRVRLRLRAEYGTGAELDEAHKNPMALADGGLPARSAASVIAGAHQESTANWKSMVDVRLGSPVAEEEAQPEVDDVEVEQEEAGEEVEPEAPPRPPPATTTRSSGRATRSTASTAAAATANLPVTNGTTLRRIVLRVPTRAAPAPARTPTANAKKATPKKTTPTRRSTGSGKKRKADNDDESEPEAVSSEEEQAPSTRRIRGAAAAAAAAPAPPPTRTLRSRASKTAAQQAAEEEKASRMRAALASDDDEDEDDE